jgi:hypothetical protein
VCFPDRHVLAIPDQPKRGGGGARVTWMCSTAPARLGGARQCRNAASVLGERLIHSICYALERAEEGKGSGGEFGKSGSLSLIPVTGNHTV